MRQILFFVLFLLIFLIGCDTRIIDEERNKIISDNYKDFDGKTKSYLIETYKTFGIKLSGPREELVSGRINEYFVLLFKTQNSEIQKVSYKLIDDTVRMTLVTKIEQNEYDVWENQNFIGRIWYLIYYKISGWNILLLILLFFIGLLTFSDKKAGIGVFLFIIIPVLLVYFAILSIIVLLSCRNNF